MTLRERLARAMAERDWRVESWDDLDDDDKWFFYEFATAAMRVYADLSPDLPRHRVSAILREMGERQT